MCAKETAVNSEGVSSCSEFWSLLYEWNSTYHVESLEGSHDILIWSYREQCQTHDSGHRMPSSRACRSCRLSTKHTGSSRRTRFVP